MKGYLFLLLVSLSAVSAYVVAPRVEPVQTKLAGSVPCANINSNNAKSVSSSRKEFFFQVATPLAGAAATSVLLRPDAAEARGRATLEQTYGKYAPRIRAGGVFYNNDLKKLVAAADWEGIKNALREPPARKKEDLTKSDSGVAARARQAGQFSDARVLVAADLLASSFSESSISAKTKKMQAAVTKMRGVVEEMESLAAQALGEEKTGLFGFGAKKVDKSQLAKQLRDLYVQGGNAYNEYVVAANDNLALQFDKFPYIK